MEWRAQASPGRRRDVLFGPATTRGPTSSRTSDQEAAVCLEQGDTRSRRHSHGRWQSKRTPARRCHRNEKPFGGLPILALQFGPGDRHGALAYKRRRGMRGRWRTIRHAAPTRAIAAAMFLADPNLDRLHLRQGSAENSKDYPDDALHGNKDSKASEPCRQPLIPA